jgi:hypothetical protein
MRISGGAAPKEYAEEHTKKGKLNLKKKNVFGPEARFHF